MRKINPRKMELQIRKLAKALERENIRRKLNDEFQSVLLMSAEAHLLRAALTLKDYQGV